MSHIRVDLPNTNNKWVGFELENVDTFIIHVEFRLVNVDTICTLTRHEHDPFVVSRILKVHGSSGYQPDSKNL